MLNVYLYIECVDWKFSLAFSDGQRKNSNNVWTHDSDQSWVKQMINDKKDTTEFPVYC